MVCHSVFSCVPPERMRSQGSQLQPIASNVYNWEMWATFVEAVSICCFLLVSRWARGS